ncbi:hypothetical protein RhiirC2_719039 [Rhizophagus irregularis]|uniref:Uncharacterized protein n=1 Tax=Rhizophagus irregularis TaxID=588596 RepID=A0A2N1MFV4_9GLOM|nr:hypothetical protein RhiirC2_719039 [Rhizophagus irregularis]
MYTFIGCLAFAKIKKDKDNNYVALDGYLEHLDACQMMVYQVICYHNISVRYHKPDIDVIETPLDLNILSAFLDVTFDGWASGNMGFLQFLFFLGNRNEGARDHNILLIMIQIFSNYLSILVINGTIDRRTNEDSLASSLLWLSSYRCVLSFYTE